MQEFLYQEEATKSFCDLIRKDKSNLLNILQSQRLAKDVIAAEVSAAVRGWYIQHKTTGTITPYRSNMVPETKAPVVSKAASFPAATKTTTVQSKQLKKTGTPPSAQPAAITGIGNLTIGEGAAPVTEPAILSLAEELKKHGEESIGLADKLNLVTDKGLAAAFYFDITVAKYNFDEIYDKFLSHFNIENNAQQEST